MSKILATVHHAAKDLYAAKMITKKNMQEYDALCLSEVELLSANAIRRMRLKNHLSQSVFAHLLNASEATVRSWEQGQKSPNGPSLKLLNIVLHKGVDGLVY